MAAKGKARATHKWTTEQRTVLHILSHNFKISWSVRTQVFNDYFQDSLYNEGFHNGLRENSLKAQYADKRPPIWVTISKEPSTDDEWRQRRDLIHRLQTVLSAVQTGARPLTQAATQTSVVVQQQHVVTPEDVRSKTPAKRLAHFMLNEPDAKRRLTAPAAIPEAIANAPIVVPVQPASVPAKRKFVPNFTNASSRKKTSKIAVAVNITTQIPAVPPPLAPSTPQSKGTRNADLEKSEYHRRIGPVLKLSPKALAKTKQPLVPVSPAVAHWNTGGLFFRYWNDKSFGSNSENGFIAGRFEENNVVGPPPKSTDLRWEDLEIHIGDKKRHSPYISVSNCLLWLLRKALKETNAGARGGKIALISVDALDRNVIYHLPPFHRQLTKRFPFLSGKWRYVGTQEFIVWHEIPKEAIISTFSVDSLAEACDRIPRLHDLMRMEIIAGRTDLKTKIMSALTEDRIKLNTNIAVAIAQLCRIFGLSGSSALDHLEHVVSDVIQGWRVAIEHMSSAEWAHLAATWMHSLCGRSTVPSPEREQQLKMTWLHGVKAGMGDFNTFRDGKLIKQMHRKAQDVGLDSPTQIVLEAMANATRAILELEQKQNSRYELASQATAFLPAIEEDFLLESDVVGPVAGLSSSSDEDEHDEIMYDDDRLGL
ncbi:hypothetical protein LTR56_025321 [Elasticomyces elasticus]|nr:hypothetical protein LTR56_025321 [Elasticomyces elasticus]KAK3621241.1 hypothetical protein LTR22_025286 [Elasticomyces elasticus]KAK4906284.1 hypothetical protein LTR49_024537 [Elasticomyces elasticus]KAK5745865.1 hypothetical protein LTS12_022929 [Elasticomyces elasticus]